MALALDGQRGDFALSPAFSFDVGLVNGRLGEVLESQPIFHDLQQRDIGSSQSGGLRDQRAAAGATGGIELAHPLRD